VKILEACGVDDLHVDLLDAHFSPSMPIGIDVVRKLRSKTNLPFDVHLMVDNNEFFIHEMISIGVQQICFHQESAFHIDHLLDMIKASGIKAGLALSPATPLEVLDFIVEKLDFILLMLINPGFAGHQGQKQVSYALRKIAHCRTFLENRQLDVPIEVDGRVSFETIPEIIAAGANILVAGSSCLFQPGMSIQNNYYKILKAINQGLAMQKNERP
jgi:ribulose-phosphate 3-epimerase